LPHQDGHVAALFEQRLDQRNGSSFHICTDHLAGVRKAFSSLLQPSVHQRVRWWSNPRAGPERCPSQGCLRDKGVSAFSDHLHGVSVHPPHPAKIYPPTSCG
jgi:hypothetical protein